MCILAFFKMKTTVMMNMKEKVQEKGITQIQQGQDEVRYEPY